MLCKARKGRFRPFSAVIGTVITFTGFASIPQQLVAALADARAELDGAWRLRSVESIEGTRQIEQDVRWVIRDGKVYYYGEPLADVTFDAQSTPKIIDLSFLDTQRAYEGVYTLAGDVLHVCVNANADGVKERPLRIAIDDKPSLRLLAFERIARDAIGSPAGYVGIALRVNEDPPGVLIQSVLEESPAKKAGLQAGDALLSVGSFEVGEDLRSVIGVTRGLTPGSDVTFRVRRDGAEKEIRVKVAVVPFSLLGVLE
jgi:uncharacterized protein (TIGR03067 family)